MTRRVVLVAFAGLAVLASARPALAQVSVGSPYLDVVARYQSGDQAKAVADMAAYPTSGLRDRARKDLRDLTCQVLCGTADCRRARAEKPAEFERVIEAWSASMPAAAALHVDTAIQAQAEDRRDVAEAHRQLALELVDLMETELAAPAAGTSPIARPRIADGPAFSGPTQTGPDPQIARRAQASQLVTLLSIWLLQLRGDLPQIQAPLARAQQRFPQDPLVALALGSLHEAHAAPNALVEASVGRQGSLEKWRQEERAYRLEQALAAYRQAVALDPTLAEAHLRLGHVLLLAGEADEAAAAFARASAETDDRRWRYLAQMLRADAADARGDRAVAIKFVAAYMRPLSFENIPKATAARVYARYVRGGEPSWSEYKKLEDFLFRYIASEAGRLRLPVQIHTGGGCGHYFNLSNGNPLLLESVLNDPALRKTTFVLIHGGYPFVKETEFLLEKPHVYADFSAQTFLLQPATLARVIRGWLEYEPEKVLFATDASPATPEVRWEESAWTTNKNAREALAIALSGMINDGDITRERALELARMVLRENARGLYGLQ
jgi:predicted TIM-barrel fold metal-dependent hydrolase